MADISKLVVEIDSNGVVKAVKNLNDFKKASTQTEKSVGSLSKNLIKGGVAFGALTTALKSAVKFTRASIKAFSDFESVKTNLRVVTGSAEEAEKQFKSLKLLASETPFEVSGLANASIMLQQVGVDAENVESTLRMLGDASGGNNELFNRIAQNYAQILSVGKASAMDMRQFAQMGLPVYQLMKDMGIQGQATAEQVTEMFKRMTSKGGTFFNGMQLQASTLNGKISTLKDTWKDYLATFAETTGIAGTVKNAIDKVTGALQTQNTLLQLESDIKELGKRAEGGDIIAKHDMLVKQIEFYKRTLIETLDYESEKVDEILEKRSGFAYNAESEFKKITNAQAELDAISEQYKQEEKLLQLERERIEENKRLVEIQQQQSQHYADIFEGIKTEYESKLESQMTELQKVQKRINELVELRDSTKHVIKDVETLPGKFVHQDYETSAFTAEEKAVIQALIDLLAEERNELRNNTGAEEKNTEKTETLNKTLLEKAEELIKESYEKGDKGGIFKGTLQKTALQAVEGTDIGNFIQGMETGGVWGGVFNTLLTALSNVIGGIEGINLILSPVTALLKEFSPTIKALLIPALYLSKALVWLAKGVQIFLNIITFGLIDVMANAWDELVDESKDLSKTTKDMNSELKSLTDRLSEYSDALDRQEEYYQRERLGLKAENKYKVNDMILTPHGVFSTNPKDTIIATKNPQDLVSGGSVNVTVNNNASNDVKVNTYGDSQNLVIEISKKIANDFAVGTNGWEGAVKYRASQSIGRSLS